MKKEKINTFIKLLLNNDLFFHTALLIISAVISAQTYILNDFGIFEIFKNAYNKIIVGANPYDFFLYKNYIWDRYLYPPQFVFILYPIFTLPGFIGAFVYLYLSILLYYLSLSKLQLSKQNKNLIFIICLPEIITCMQNLQTNLLVVAGILFAFGYIKENKPIMAAFSISFSFIIKVYPALVGIFALSTKKKLHIIVYTLCIVIIISLVPLFKINWDRLVEVNQLWFKSLATDTSSNEISKSFSVMALLMKLSIMSSHFFILQLLALMLTLFPFVHIKQQLTLNYQLLLLSLLLVFIIIFNHAAESPTYVIAATGVSIWYITAQKNSVNTFLFILFLIFCVLSRTDLYPSGVRQFLYEYKSKVWPCTLIWLKILIELFQNKNIIQKTEFAVEK
ncbi:MAG: DUF2029 domain-containing protein [Bacteroidetes bacterium]|nr:DUF2029 domain-containing protein [Bacteroidota bacterium]